MMKRKVNGNSILVNFYNYRIYCIGYTWKRSNGKEKIVLPVSWFKIDPLVSLAPHQSFILQFDACANSNLEQRFLRERLRRNGRGGRGAGSPTPYLHPSTVHNIVLPHETKYWPDTHFACHNGKQELEQGATKTVYHR